MTALRRVVVRDDGLLVRPRFRRARLVPWTRIKGVRIAPVDEWSGPNAAPGGHGYYAVQVKLDGEWRRVGPVRRARHSGMPREIREALVGERLIRTAGEWILYERYAVLRTVWEAGGGTPSDADDNWPRF